MILAGKAWKDSLVIKQVIKQVHRSIAYENQQFHEIVKKAITILETVYAKANTFKGNDMGHLLYSMFHTMITNWPLDIVLDNDMPIPWFLAGRLPCQGFMDLYKQSEQLKYKAISMIDELRTWTSLS